MKQTETEWWEQISFVRDTTTFNETNRDKVVGANFICEGYYTVHIKKVLHTYLKMWSTI